MKIRKGFVSNSSSSSFVIGCKKSLTKEMVVKAIAPAMKDFIDDLAKFIVKEVKPKPLSEEEFIEYMGGLEDFPRAYKKMLGRGFRFYQGFASNDSGVPVELALCEIGLEYDGEDVAIRKEGGY